LRISDDGRGFESSGGEPESGGTGLYNVRARLENLYGDGQDLTIDEPASGGVVVGIKLPFRRAA
jgi:signal transduction histidine kinase